MITGQHRWNTMRSRGQEHFGGPDVAPSSILVPLPCTKYISSQNCLLLFGFSFLATSAMIIMIILLRCHSDDHHHDFEHHHVILFQPGAHYVIMHHYWSVLPFAFSPSRMPQRHNQLLLQYQCNKDHITRLNGTHFSAIQFSSRNEFKATYWNAVSRRPCYNHLDDLIVIVHLCSFEKASSSAVVEPSATFCLRA